MPRQRSLHHHDNSPEPRLRGASILLAIAALALLLAACGPARSPSSSSSGAAPAQNVQSNHRAFTYVAIGASDAFGVGTYDPAHDNWPTVLANLLGPDAHLVNLGIPGETVAEARQTELPIALDAKPALVTVWLGVNDIIQSVPVATYEQQLQALLVSLHQNTNARIYVANIPDLSLLPSFAGENQAALHATIVQWNATIARAVDASGARLVDLYASWSELANHPEYIASDGFHPSTVGARRLAEVFQKAITPSLPAIRAAADAAGAA
jgi:lysophospholipase L1-like esterase